MWVSIRIMLLSLHEPYVPEVTWCAMPLWSHETLYTIVGYPSLPVCKIFFSAGHIPNNYAARMRYRLWHSLNKLVMKLTPMHVNCIGAFKGAVETECTVRSHSSCELGRIARRVHIQRVNFAAKPPEWFEVNYNFTISNALERNKDASPAKVFEELRHFCFTNVW